MMWLLLITLCAFGFTNSHVRFSRAKYPDFFNDKDFKLFNDYVTVTEYKASSITPTFTNPKAQDFYVNGTTIPDVNFDVGPSWAGLLPISNATDESRQLFFWYFPSQSVEGVNDLVIWLNGGPGCSSLEGLLQENGPFLWQWGTAYPVPNPYAWNTLANVLWVEQPVGTGFSQGTPSIHDENELAEQFYGFLTQFFSVFAEISNSSVYITGESYAGYYVEKVFRVACIEVKLNLKNKLASLLFTRAFPLTYLELLRFRPYIANYIYGLTGTAPLNINLQGILIIDPEISSSVMQREIPALPFVYTNQNIFNLNASFLSYLDEQNMKCGYANYTQLYVSYPPNGSLPTPSPVSNTDNCDIWTAIFYAALIINPAFNEYRITDTPPILWDVLGFPGSFPNQQSPIYFARLDVQTAIHAPNINWTECVGPSVFVNEIDQSLPSAYSILPNVIEKSKRTIIVNGQHDFVIIAEGTRNVIQNMTWYGQQGFQVQPTARFIVPNQGDMGFVHTERGLTYVEVVLCGHMVPQFQPRAALQILKYLLGRIESLANETAATTTSTRTSMTPSIRCFSSLHLLSFVLFFSYI